MAQSQENGDLLVESFEVAGVMEDEFGNKWTIPAGELSEDPTFLTTDPLRLPKKDPRFWYEFVRRPDVENYTGGPGQFAVVTRKEVGFSSLQVANPVEGAPDVNRSENEAYVVGDLILMKTPTVLHERMERAKQKMADGAVEATLGQKGVDAVKRFEESGLQFGIDRTTLSYKVIEKNEQPFRLQEQSANTGAATNRGVRGKPADKEEV